MPTEPVVFEFLDQISRSLASAATTQDRNALEEAMVGCDNLAKLVHAGSLRWVDLQGWASSHAQQVVAAREAFEDWGAWMDRTFRSGGEEEAERALTKRSQLELARQLFANTQAIAALEYVSDAEIDEEYREEAERLAIDPPDFVPRSHTWWRWNQPARIADQILNDIARSLVASAGTRDRAAINPAMVGFESLAKLVHDGNLRWEELKPWGAEHACEVIAARGALADYFAWMDRTFRSGGEEEAERAFKQRSRIEFARQVFTDTPAAAVFAEQDDSEIDAEYREEAERLALDPPDFVPRTHTWWRRKP